MAVVCHPWQEDVLKRDCKTTGEWREGNILILVRLKGYTASRNKHATYHASSPSVNQIQEEAQLGPDPRRVSTNGEFSRT
jgi:hypothetical protein